MKGILSLRGFRKLRTGVIVATGVFLFATSNVQVVQASEEDGVWEARTVEQVKADIASLAKDSNYVIKWGDTLSVISEATGISMDALAQMNKISNVNLIYAHNELGFTQPISTTTGNQTVSKQTVTVVNRQNKQEEVKAFEVTTKEDTQSGKTETVVTEVKPTTKEEKAVSKTEKAPVVTAKEETSKVNQTLVSSQPAEKAATIDKKETAKADSTAATTGKVEAQKAEQAPAVVKPAATKAKETTPSNPVEEKKQTEGTTPKETTKGEVDKKETTSPTDNKENSTSEEAPTSPTPAAEPEEKVESSAPTTTGKESTTVEKQTDTKPEEASAAVEKPTATEAKETTPSNQTEEKTDKQIEQPATNTPSKDSVENNEIAPSANNDSNEVASHEEGKKDATVVPKEVTKENKDALDSHKQNKLHEINESSLTSEQKEQAVTKVKELTTKAEKAIDEATTSEDQAKVVDQYEKDLIAIETPNVETPKSDFTKPVESHNPSGSTTIGEGGAISTLASSTPAASEQATSTASTPTTSSPAVSTSTATNPSVSETSTSNTSSENTGFRNAPAYQPRVVRRARSVDAPKDQVAIYYNFVEMKDIAGFLGDPGESIITVPAGSTSEQIRTIVKAKIDAKKAELAKRGYTFTEDYFVDKPQEDTIRYDYVVNFTKAASLRVAPVSQPRAARHRRSVVESPVKTRTITLYYQLAGLEIAGALGTPGKNYVITVPETASATEIQQAIDDATRSEKAELGRFFKYVRETNLQTDILNRGFGNFDYVITYTR